MAKKPITVTLRKPSSAPRSEAAAEATASDRDAFVAAAAPAVDLRAGFRSITLWLPEELADRLALHCREADRDVSALVSEIVQGHLDALASAKAPAPPKPATGPIAALVAWVHERVSALRPAWIFRAA